MKIGIDARLYRGSTAGIGRYSQNLIKNILELDQENEYILLMTTEDEQEFKAQSEKLKAENRNVIIVITDIGHYSLAEQTKLSKILEEQKCDLWHFLNFNLPVNFKGNYVVTIHDLTLFFYEGRNKKSFIYKLAYKYIMSRACKNSKKIIAISEHTKHDIEQVFKINPEKIKVVYEAADDKEFCQVSSETISKIKNKYDLTEEPVILYVGQWRPHKNLTGLIQAFNELRKTVKAKLVIVGKVDLAFPEVSESIDISPNKSDIIKTGFVSEEELTAFYKLANVFVFPSYYEGFGLPGLEAMTAGLPVVSSDRTSLPEIYGKAAIYFNPSDIFDMKDKILSVIQNPEAAEELKLEGQKVISQFSWAKTAQETINIYKQVQSEK